MSAHGPFQARFPAAENATETWRGLHGSSLAIALRAAAAAEDRATLVVTRSSHQAQSLFRDLELLATQALPVLLFPDHETLPYDPFSPHPDIIAARLRTLSELAALERFDVWNGRKDFGRFPRFEVYRIVNIVRKARQVRLLISWPCPQRSGIPF